MHLAGTLKVVGSTPWLTKQRTQPTLLLVTGLDTLYYNRQSQLSDSSRSGSKYGPGDNYKTVSFSYKDNRQHWS